MQRIFVFLLLIVTTILSACSGGQLLPSSVNATLLASLDADRSRFDAWGQGEEYEYAVEDAQKVAIAKALQALAQTSEERSALRGFEETLYEDFIRFVEGADLQDRRRNPDGSLRVRMHVVVNKSTLEQALVDNGIIQARDTLIEELENPSVAVMLADSIARKPWARFAVDHATSYLTDKRFQVLNLEQADTLQRMQQDLQALGITQKDPAADIALQIGSDLYIVVEVQMTKGKVGSDGTLKVSASARAFETTTARQVGAATGFSKNYAATDGVQEKAIAEAVSDAMDRIQVSIMDYWKLDARKGNQFLLTIQGAYDGEQGMDTRRAVHKAVLQVAKEQKQILATASQLRYRIWHKGDTAELLFALQDALSAAGGSLRSRIENRKLLVLEYQP